MLRKVVAESGERVDGLAGGEDEVVLRAATEAGCALGAGLAKGAACHSVECGIPVESRALRECGFARNLLGQ